MKKQCEHKSIKTVLKRALSVLASIVCAIVIIFAIYLGIYYHAEIDPEDYKREVVTEDGTVTSYVFSVGEGFGERSMVDGCYVQSLPMEDDVENESQKKDLIIFYPGAKVEYVSYLPLCYALSEQGVDCYIVKMPGNLAFFGMDKAEKIMEQYDGYDNYYLMGHSLGGAMGASFVAEDIAKYDRIKGMIFLAAYPTTSLQKEGFEVLSIYGSEDLVLNMEKIEEGRQYMPDDYTELVIEGGNHAQFGNYGDQKGDGVAAIAREEQQSQTVEAILEMIQQ